MMLYSLYYMSLYTFAAMKAAKDRAVGKAGEMMMNNMEKAGVLRFAKENRDAVKYWWPSTADAVNALVRKNVVAGNVTATACSPHARQAAGHRADPAR